MRRFCRHGASVAAAFVLLALLSFALLVPALRPYGVEFRDGYYKNVLPKWQPLAFLGWDGCQNRTVNQASFDYYTAIGAVRNVKARQPADLPLDTPPAE